jgi:hypothetical protein
MDSNRYSLLSVLLLLEMRRGYYYGSLVPFRDDDDMQKEPISSDVYYLVSSKGPKVDSTIDLLRRQRIRYFSE